MRNKKLIAASTLLLCILQAARCVEETSSKNKTLDTSRDARLMVPTYWHRPAEPYTYPGPSPPVKMPPRRPDPYLFYNPHYGHTDQQIPKWCKNMMKRNTCGEKCLMLRNICKNMGLKQQLPTLSPGLVPPSSSPPDQRQDAEASPSILTSHYLKKIVPLIKKPTVHYVPAGLPNTYYAQGGFAYAPAPPRPFSFYNGPQGQFAYEDSSEEEPKEEPKTTEAPTTTTTTPPPPPPPPPPPKMDPPQMSLPKSPGTYPVKISKTAYIGSPDYGKYSQVQTVSPLLLEYDALGKKQYYGDRIFLGTVLPVAAAAQEHAARKLGKALALKSLKPFPLTKLKILSQAKDYAGGIGQPYAYNSISHGGGPYKSVQFNKVSNVIGGGGGGIVEYADYAYGGDYSYVDYSYNDYGDDVVVC